MFRRVHLSFFSVIAAVCFFTVTSVAQTAAVSGRVETKKADGTVAPVVGAMVEVFRTDIKAGGPSTTTDTKGNFSFAGLLSTGSYVVSISAAGFTPTYFPGIKPGTKSDNFLFTLTEGDGRRLTPEEVREAAAQSSSGGLSAEEQKKQQAEHAQKVKEVESKNAKIQQETAIIQSSLKDGNAAYTAKDWDLAISKYNEGINANPTFAGSAPVLMNNKGAALRERAVATYNQNVKATDVSVKVAAFTKVRADLGEAADSYHKSWTILQAAQAADISPEIKTTQSATAVRGAADTFRLMAQTEQVDETKIEIAKTVVPEYITIETEPAKKEQAKLILGDLYRVTGNADNAIAEYKKAIESSPDNLDAMAGLGLSLVNAGYINNNKEQLQEGANYLQKYSTAAPDGHKFKADAVGLIESLKTEQKIAPQKVAPAKRRGN